MTILDIAEVLMGQSPPGSDCNSEGRGMPLLNGPTEFGFRYPNPVQYTTNPKKIARTGDLLFCVRGSTVGRMNYTDQQVAIGRGLASFRSKYSTKHTRLIEYLIYESLESILQSATGSTFPNVSKEQIYNWSWELPSLEKQLKIVDILGSFDDKIALNRRMNETLEQMAMTLYKHWFVDFGPFQDGEYMETVDGNIVPKDWAVKQLGEVVMINEKSLGRNYPYDKIEYIDISSVGTGVLDGTTNYPVKGAPSRAKRLVQAGDTIWSTVRPNRKSYLYIHKPAVNTVASTGFVVLTPKAIPASYLYCHVTTNEFVDYLTSNADGSAYPAVRPDVFARATVYVPAKEVLKSFDEKVAPLISQMQENMIENNELQRIRDFLLPRLLSGEIEVNAAEEHTKVVLSVG
ncbi:restriction endonuclease subunit S [Paenibacillus sp. FSL H7-0331]|uniref:restriction endonuclease subunit S n=1 Tax=Paenibacillus sp. FSL H7-0331 TaxID=1920421 RepID=UPI0015C38ACA|nr:restriction endonuclease subunit S [Paenibacillus sp. FSL H7-0331]